MTLILYKYDVGIVQLSYEMKYSVEDPVRDFPTHNQVFKTVIGNSYQT